MGLNAILLMGVMGITLAARSASASSFLKIPVGIFLAEDRWITLSDGGRVYQGLETSYLMGQKLFDSGKYLPILLRDSGSAVRSQQIQEMGLQARAAERTSQIPQEWTSWLNTGRFSTGPIPGVLFTIKPVVETLLYASGNRSNRVVYGFSPTHLNPFNMGRGGALDNEFVASNEQQQKCEKPDFFNGQFNPLGWGPFQSTFGSNMDEGFVFEILGYGFGFKTKKFEVHSQIRFIVENLINGEQKNYVYQTRGLGQDVFVAGHYSGFSLGVEIQRRKTLLQALKQMLPQIIDDIVGQGFDVPWQSWIIGNAAGQILMVGGSEENVWSGLRLMSQTHAIYEVTRPSRGESELKSITPGASPQLGEALRAYDGLTDPWITNRGSTATRTLTAQIFKRDMRLPVNIQDRASAQTTDLARCFGKRANWIEETVDGLLTLYALWRYHHVFDQAQTKGLEPGAVLSPTPLSPTPPVDRPLRIALIDSGVDVRDKTVSHHLVKTQNRDAGGFDFISWDPRPSDDNGHGTAAVKYLAQLSKVPFIIMPAKVIGSRGETHSSAVYDGFSFAVQNKADAVLIPWSTDVKSLTAYKLGADLAAQAGIPVFVAPGTIPEKPNIFVPKKSEKKSFVIKGLGGATLRLSSEGMAAVEGLAMWMNSGVRGDRYAKHESRDLNWGRAVSFHRVR